MQSGTWGSRMEEAEETGVSSSIYLETVFSPERTQHTAEGRVFVPLE